MSSRAGGLGVVAPEAKEEEEAEEAIAVGSMVNASVNK